MTAPEHAHSACEHANEQALRDRIRDVIHAAADKHLPICDEDGCECDIAIVSPMYGNGPTTRVEGSPEGLAEVCAAVVQPALDAKDAEIAQRKGDVDMLSDRVTELEGDSDYWRQRAEAAEARLRDQNGHHT